MASPANVGGFAIGMDEEYANTQGNECKDQKAASSFRGPGHTSGRDTGFMLHPYSSTIMTITGPESHPGSSARLECPSSRTMRAMPTLYSTMGPSDDFLSRTGVTGSSSTKIIPHMFSSSRLHTSTTDAALESGLDFCGLESMPELWGNIEAGAPSSVPSATSRFAPESHLSPYHRPLCARLLDVEPYVDKFGNADIASEHSVFSHHHRGPAPDLPSQVPVQAPICQTLAAHASSAPSFDGFKAKGHTIERTADLHDHAYSRPQHNDPDGPWSGINGSEIAMAIEALSGQNIQRGKLLPACTGKEIEDGLLSGRISLIRVPAGHEDLQTLADDSFPRLDPADDGVHILDVDGFVFATKYIPSANSEDANQIGAIKRKKGRDTFMPPPGFARICSEYGTVMTWYDCFGRHNCVTSWALPQQFPPSKFGNIQFTIVELLMFLPEHWRRPEYITRLHVNGWPASSVQALINWSREAGRHTGVGNSAIQSHIDKAGARKTRDDLGDDGVTEFSCINWARTETEIVPDYYVRDIPAGIRRARFPSGADKGGFTYALEYVLDHPQECHNLKVTGLENFIIAKGFDLCYQRMVPGSKNPDREAWERWNLPLKKYRISANKKVVDTDG